MVERGSEAVPCRVDGSLAGFWRQMFQLGEDLLNRVRIGRIGREENALGSGGANGVSDCFAFVASQIVERDDLSWPQRRDEALLDIGEEPRAIDRAVKDAWRYDPAAAQRGHKS